MPADATQATRTMADGGLRSDISLPYVVEDVVLMSPGTWNNMTYRQDDIEQALQETDFEDPEEKNYALFADHEDREIQSYIGKVKNIRMEGEDLVGDLEVVSMQTAVLLEYGATFGVSPKVTGRSRDGETMEEFTFENFSVVVTPAVKTTYMYSDDEENGDGLTRELSDDDLEAYANEFGVTVDDNDDPQNILFKALNGDSTMSEETEQEDAEFSKDDLVDAVADEVMDQLDDKLETLKEDKTEDEPEEDVSEFDDFEAFAKERMDEDEDVSLSDLAEEYEEEQKSTEDRLEEVMNDFEEKIDDLEEKIESKEETIEEMSEKVDEKVERASVRDPSAAKERKEELMDQDIETLDKQVHAELEERFGL